MNIGSIILALLVFSFIILFHEFGHFIVAKYNQVGVIEFSLGMGPRLISVGKTPEGRKVLFFKQNQYFEAHPEYENDTIYSWKLLPFGGSCMMLGEDEQIEDSRAFGNQSVYARMAIIFAGPLFNFILAFLLSLILVGTFGYEKPVIRNVTSGGAMDLAGVQKGDVITSINGTKIVLSGEIGYYKVFHSFSNKPMDITLERDGQKIEVTATPQLTTADASGNKEYMLGFEYGEVVRPGFVGIIQYSAYEVKYYIKTTIQSLLYMLRGKVSVKDLSGPVGIVQVVSDNVKVGVKAGQKNGKITMDSIKNVVYSILVISILLTANLGVMNLLPIPALDGGRLLFLIIEWIRRKPLPEKAEAYVNTAGFLLLMALMVVVLGSDVFKIIQEHSHASK